MARRDDRGVVLLRNIPHGFDEKGMKEYFNQFGVVTRLRLSVSRKTGKSREYAYIEFECPEVAKIVADTMNNYLMYEKLLKCRYIPPEEVPPKIFVLSNKKFISTVEKHKTVVNRLRPYDSERKIIGRRLKSIRAAEEKLKALGINFSCVIVNDPKDQGRKVEPDKVEIDSDDDIRFQTPPTAVKVKKSKSRLKRSD